MVSSATEKPEKRDRKVIIGAMILALILIVITLLVVRDGCDRAPPEPEPAATDSSEPPCPVDECPVSETTGDEAPR